MSLVFRPFRDNSTLDLTGRIQETNDFHVDRRLCTFLISTLPILPLVYYSSTDRNEQPVRLEPNQRVILPRQHTFFRTRVSIGECRDFRRIISRQYPIRSFSY